MLTVFDVANAAQNAGCTILSTRTLINFLAPNEDYFTEEDFGVFIDIISDIKAGLIDVKCSEVFPEKEAEYGYGKVAGKLTEEERYTLWNSFNPEELEEMLTGHVEACTYARAFFSLWDSNDGYPMFSAGMRDEGYQRYITYISEHGTIPASVAFDGTLTEEHLPTLTADGYVHTGWVFTYHALEQPVKVGDYFRFGPLLKAVWEEAQPEEPEDTKPISYIEYLANPKYRKYPFRGFFGWLWAKKHSGGGSEDQTDATLVDGTLYIKSATATLNGKTLEVR